MYRAENVLIVRMLLTFVCQGSPDLVCAPQEERLCSEIQQLVACRTKARLTRLQEICSIRDLSEGHPAVATGRKQQRQRERGVFAAQVGFAFKRKPAFMPT